MNIVELYFILLKGTATSFAGLASMPVIQEALVTQRHVLTAEQLNEAIVITRSTPGPVGLWVVSAGYFAAGIPGAIAGWLAMITPAMLVIPLVQLDGRRIEHPRVRSVLQTVVVASAGLLLAAAILLGREALIDPATLAIGIVALGLLLGTKIEVAWVTLGAAVVAMAADAMGVVRLQI